MTADPGAGFDVWPLVLTITDRDRLTGVRTVREYALRDLSVYPAVQYLRVAVPMPERDRLRVAMMTGHVR